MNVLNATELFIRKWSILRYMNFTSIKRKKSKEKKSDAWPFAGVAETLKKKKGFIKTKNL